MDNPNGLESTSIPALLLIQFLIIVQPTVLQFVSADLPQARVNKCLLALINRKIVAKDNSTVS